MSWWRSLLSLYLGAAIGTSLLSELRVVVFQTCCCCTESAFSKDYGAVKGHFLRVYLFSNEVGASANDCKFKETHASTWSESIVAEWVGKWM
ncbi:hypothetical protein BKA67DRAFT_569141 [Truncatella angustata]|uniref:Secreted protein n=1 Tax=Truncatella angustata TaxID=152316 RepID=A0A9P8UJF7_9PEZI|nr:uncharacterized protein BKA67DRAFT_569141 [Truncatella angustata]KAH6653307.1 hypothetical protein BKA67DRAFT_569141 [Truncatella angustata]